MSGPDTIVPELTPLASVVVPVFNEEDSVASLFQRLGAVVSKIPQYRWELVLIDDGSSDKTVEVIQKNRSLFPGLVRLVQFSRNFGHQPAVLAGMEESTGEFIIVIDADLQDPPELFSAFIEKYRQGFDVVYGIRTARHESWFKLLTAGVFYRFMDLMTDIRIPLDAGDFGLLSRRVAQFMIRHSDKDPYLRGLRSWAGYSQTGVEYDRPNRQAGETKYTFSKMLKLAGSGIFGYSSLPLRFSTLFGLFSVGMCILYAIYALVGKFVYNANQPGWTSLVLVILFLGGVQLISIGLLGEYIACIYKQVQPRPHFIVKTSRTL
jgi:polyisoprenyl-phosphate glycosyltransferase